MAARMVVVYKTPPDPAAFEKHYFATLHFDDMAALRSAFASPAGEACAADRRIFAPDDALVQMFLFESLEA